MSSAFNRLTNPVWNWCYSILSIIWITKSEMFDLHVAVFHNSPFEPLSTMIKGKCLSEWWGLSMSFVLIFIDGGTEDALTYPDMSVVKVSKR